MSDRDLILVTGAPRTGTTPVGNLLAQCAGAVSLYEPLGPTGLSWIATPFPIVGEGLGIEQDQLEKLLQSLKRIQPGRLNSQVRHGGPQSFRTRIFGSRTLHSLRVARLQPWARTVIWKDPHAILLVPDLVDKGVNVVVTARTPWAHAASYKRLGWRSKAAQVYLRWSRKYGPCTVCEEYLDRCADSVIGAALLWRLSYLPLVRTGALAEVQLVTSEDLERDERATYVRLITELGLTSTSGVDRTLSRERRDAPLAALSQKTHDWQRSVASLNRYWHEVLTEEDLNNVHAITDDVSRHILGPRMTASQEQNSSLGTGLAK